MGNTHCCEEVFKGGEFKAHQFEKHDNKAQPFKNFTQFQRSLRSSIPYKTQNTGKKEEDRQNSSNGINLSMLMKDLSYNHQSTLEKQTYSMMVKQDEATKSRDKNPSSQMKKLQLNPFVKKTYETKNFFPQKKGFQGYLRQYNGEVYQGQLDYTKRTPEGFGKHYKRDESLYIGQFLKGEAYGNGVYIFPDGSYYQGLFISNMATSDQGLYQSDFLTYKGGFKNNLFHGNGQQQGLDHKFKGVYNNGFKTFGTFQWKQQNQSYIYQGTFNQNGQFQGNGKLIQPYGVYEGQFQKSYKHGKGIYKFKNGILYEGHYRYNIRSGKGKIINPNGKLAYEGQFLDGLPHGDLEDIQLTTSNQIQKGNHQ